MLASLLFLCKLKKLYLRFILAQQINQSEFLKKNSSSLALRAAMRQLLLGFHQIKKEFWKWEQSRHFPEKHCNPKPQKYKGEKCCQAACLQAPAKDKQEMNVS